MAKFICACLVSIVLIFSVKILGIEGRNMRRLGKTLKAYVKRLSEIKKMVNINGSGKGRLIMEGSLEDAFRPMPGHGTGVGHSFQP